VPIPGGAGVAPVLTLTAVGAPSPGVLINVTSVDTAATTITIYRTTGSGGRVIVRGASGAIVSGTFTVTDFEVPLGEVATYTAATFDVGGVASDESAGVAITVNSDRSWLTDPLEPASAARVWIRDPGDRERALESAMLLPIGATAPTMVYGVRQLGAGQLSIATLTLADTIALRTITEGGVLLLRAALSAHDIGTMYLGVPSLTERRIGKLAEGSRYFDLTYVRVARPDPSIPAPLFDWDAVAASGKTWSQLSATGKTWITLQQTGP
jgi:hypothetical protein